MVGDDGREWLDLADAAKRMSMTVAQVKDLARRRVLRSRETWAGLQVEPAVVTYHGPPPTREPAGGGRAAGRFHDAGSSRTDGQAAHPPAGPRPGGQPQEETDH